MWVDRVRKLFSGKGKKWRLLFTRAGDGDGRVWGEARNDLARIQDISI
jgi:hypothetical protein